jgi:hypothetical protein
MINFVLVYPLLEFKSNKGKLKGTRARHEHYSSPIGNETRVCDGSYLGRCTITANIDHLFNDQPYTSEDPLYLARCLKDLPPAKIKEMS